MTQTTNYKSMVTVEYARHKVLSNYMHSPNGGNEVLNEHKQALLQQQDSHAAYANHVAHLDRAAQQRHNELMATLTKPKTIIRDAEGRISGVV